MDPDDVGCGGRQLLANMLALTSLLDHESDVLSGSCFPQVAKDTNSCRFEFPTSMFSFTSRQEGDGLISVYQLV